MRQPGCDRATIRPGLGHNLGVQSDPAEAYRTRLSQRRSTYERLTQIDLQLSYVRLGIFGLGVLIAVAAWQQALSTSCSSSLSPHSSSSSAGTSG